VLAEVMKAAEMMKAETAVETMAKDLATEES
jgi:hypothetical protein